MNQGLRAESGERRTESGERRARWRPRSVSTNGPNRDGEPWRVVRVSRGGQMRRMAVGAARVELTGSVSKDGIKTTIVL